MKKQTNPLKRLAGETAIYGMGTIVPRLLNYLLTPLFTRVLVRADYAILTEMYSWIALLLVLTTYGMETSFFRFSSRADDKKRVYSTAFSSILITTILFFGVIIGFRGSLASVVGYATQPEFILFVAAIVSMDALASIPFASLREQRRAKWFSAIKLTNVGVNVLLNVFFLWICPTIASENPDSGWLVFYRPDQEVTYIFIANIVSSMVTLVMLLPEIIKSSLHLDRRLLKRMLVYAYPLAIIILAGMLNEVADKLMLKYLLPQETLNERMTLLGEYGANFKLAVLMSIFIQMFRFAAEPFFFAQSEEKNARKIYAAVLKFFVIFGWLIFLGVMLFLDVLKYFIDEKFHDGLVVVPILLVAKLLQGVFYNQSVWYKLTGMTRKGALIALSGTAVMVATNLILVPRIGYQGAALGQLLCYSAMVLISFFMGRKYYRVNYPWMRMLFYSVLAMLLYYVSTFTALWGEVFQFTLNAVIILSYLMTAYLLEKNKIHEFSS